MIDTHPDWIKLVFSIEPPELGATLFVTKLEYNHFTPDTDKNAEFGMMTSENQFGATALVLVPAAAKAIVDQLAEECHLKQTTCPISEVCSSLTGTAIHLETKLRYEEKDYQQLLTDELSAANQIHEEFVAAKSPATSTMTSLFDKLQ